ncbi:MAG: glycosyltransferase, partial [Planctomycetota bacterium]
DVYQPAGFAAACRRLIATPRLGLVYSPAGQIDEAGVRHRRLRAGRWNAQRLTRRNVIPLPSVVLRHSATRDLMVGDAATAAGPLDESLGYQFAYDFWLRLMQAGCRFERQAEEIGSKRRHRGNRFFHSEDPRHWRRSAEELLAVAQRRLPQPSISWALYHAHAMAAWHGVPRATSRRYDHVVLTRARRTLSGWGGRERPVNRLRLITRHCHEEARWLMRRPMTLTRYLPRGWRRAITGVFERKLFRLQQYPPRTLRLPPAYHRQAAAVDAAPAPQISIVTPNYNQEPYIGETLRSVLDQRYPNLQYIVQDGASTDGSMDIVRRHADAAAADGAAGRLTYDSRPDNGQTHALNLGMRHATGDILAYLNSDDVLLPGSLAFVAEFFAANPGVDVLYGDRVMIDDQSQEIGRWVLPAYDPTVIQWADYIPQETMFWRRRAWRAVGERFDESFQFAMDWDLIDRFRTAGMRFRHARRLLGGFRILADQKTNQQLETVGATEMNRIRKRALGFVPTDRQIRKAITPFMRRQWVAHHRAGIANKLNAA